MYIPRKDTSKTFDFLNTNFHSYNYQTEEVIVVVVLQCFCLQKQSSSWKKWIKSRVRGELKMLKGL